jgi:membrane fusion protein, multidrug efflux system
MRYVYAILALVVVVGGLAAVKVKQIGSLIAFGQAMQKAGPPPESVGSGTASTDIWQEEISAVGDVAAARGVTVSNDAPGIVSAIHFESGKMVHEGEVLLELDSHVERSQLAAVEARRELAAINAGRTRALVTTEALPRAQQDTDDAVVKTSVSDLAALGAQIDRKIVRAPFSGKLGIRLVNLGQYLNSGTAITSLESTDSVFVDFSLPQEDLKTVALGMPVRVTLEGTDGESVPGAIKAIDPSLDAITRSIKLRASLSNKDDRLLPGMFVRVAVELPTKRDVVMVPSLAIVHASFGDSVFVVEDRQDENGAPAPKTDGPPVKTARQQFVKLGESRGDFVSVTAGLTAGQTIVTAGAFKLHNGAPIIVNDAVQAKAELHPHPENR